MSEAGRQHPRIDHPPRANTTLTRRPPQQQDGAPTSQTLIDLVLAMAWEQADADHEAERQGK